MPDDTLDDSLLKLGVLIKQQRYQQRRQAKDVAAAAGMTPTYLWMLENGTNPKTGRPSRPSAEKLTRLADTLELDAAVVFDLAGYPPQESNAAGSGPSATAAAPHGSAGTPPRAQAPSAPASNPAPIGQATGRRFTVRFPSTSSHPPFDGGRIPFPEPFVGRQADLQWILARLRPAESQTETPGIAALRGLPGIGKSALAGVAVSQLQREECFPDGIAVVRCEGTADDVAILRQVLARFHPRRQEPHAGELAGLAEEALQLLGGARTLVVLDNIEPDLDLDAIIVPLRAAGTTILLTARHRLPLAAVPSSASYKLDALAAEEAEELFARSYGRASTADLSRSELDAAQRIVVALDRHTMAVKLAGAYAQSVGRDLGALAQELEDDPARALALPEGENLGAISHTFETSYHALHEDAQRLFAALATFANNDIGRHAALALAASLSLAHPPEAVVNLLVLRALLEGSPNESMLPGSDRERLRLHPLLRSLASSKLKALPDDVQESASRAIAEYYAQYVANNSNGLNSTDAPNIEGAITWAEQHHDADLMVRLCRGMQVYWRDRGRTSASLDFLPVALAAARQIAERTRDPEMRLTVASLELTHGMMLEQEGRLDDAANVFHDNLTNRKRTRDRRGECNVLSQMGSLALRRGRLKEAEGRYEQSLAIWREIGDRQGEGADLSNLGRIAEQRGQLMNAEGYYEQSLAISREVGDLRGEGAMLASLGHIAQRRGRLEEAKRYFEQSLAIRHEVGDLRGEGADLSSLGQVELLRGFTQEAIANFARSLAIRQEVLDRQGVGEVLANLGQLALLRGELAVAEAYYIRGLAALREVMDRQGEGVVLSNLGQVAQARGQMERAEAFYTESLKVLREVQDRQGEGAALFHLAQIAESSGRFDDAERLHRESLAISEAVQSRLDIADSLLSLGRFLLQHERDCQAGGDMLLRAITTYDEMGLPRADEARALARQFGLIE